jgi:N-acetylmuramoyl-L-alanine amidase
VKQNKFFNLPILILMISTFALLGCTRSASKAPAVQIVLTATTTPQVIQSTPLAAKVINSPSPEATATAEPTRKPTHTPEPVKESALGTQMPGDSPYKGIHVVRQGETLYSIGRAYKVVPEAIAQANGIPFTGLIYPGNVLKIPRTEWKPVPPGPVADPQFTP